MKHFYQDVEGWFDFEELYREALRRMPEDARMVEVGVYKGRSFFFLAVEVENSGKRIELYAVDRFNWPSNALREFDTLRREHGLTQNVHTVTADSVTASRLFAEASLDFVFLDAEHTYEAVSADIAAWWPKIRKGGILAGHDWCDEFPGVERAVRERFGQYVANHRGVWNKIPPSSPLPGVYSWWVEK